MKVEIDTGSGFQSFGRTELLSVPFALYAESAASVKNLVLSELEDVGNQAPANKQVLKWNGTNWIPMEDEKEDADADPSNEIQSLSLAGNTLSLSRGGGNLNLPTGTTYTAGNGISLNGNVITNTGDLNETNEIQSLSLSGNNLSLSNGGGSINLPAGTTYSAGNGIIISGNTITNTGDTNPSDDVLIGSNATGDLSGTYPNPSVSAIQGQGISSTAPANGQVLKWNGNEWAAADDIEGVPPVWSLSGIDAYYDTGHVGIGAGASPKVPFHIGANHRVLFGSDTSGAGSKLMWLPDVPAFRVGTLTSGPDNTNWDRDSLGQNSFASGFDTKAKGFASTAIGFNTNANGAYSLAAGRNCDADGRYSFVMGSGSKARADGSIALGSFNRARGFFSLAAGFYAEADGIQSIAIGTRVRADAYASLAIGRYNVGGGNEATWVNSDPLFEIGIGTSSTNRMNAMTVKKNGNVGIGNSDPQAALQVNGQIRFTTVEYMEDGGLNEIAVRGDLRPISDNFYDLGTGTNRWDDVFATNGTVQTSDLRLKENIEPIPYGLDEVLRMNPVRFTWKDQPQQDPKLGLIAQDLLPLINEVVKTHDLQPTEEDDTVFTKKKLDRLGVYYSDLIPVLIKATQEQQQIIEKQQAQIQEMENRLKKLEKPQK